MKRAIKEYFEEKERGEVIEVKAFLKIREERLKRWKFFSLFLLLSNLLLFALMGRELLYKEYEPMSAGYEVLVRPGVSFEELDKFLKEKELIIKGPTPEGYYLLEGVVKKEDIKKSGIFIYRE